MNKKSLLGSLLVLAQCGVASAQRVNPNTDTQYNWNATTGLINIPIARVLRPGTFFSAFDFKSKRIQDLFGSEFLATSSNPAGGGDQGNGSFHFMFSPLQNVEVGLLGLHDANREGNVNTLGRLLVFPPARDFSTAVKVLLKEESENFPSIAVGVENLTDPNNGDAEPNANFFKRGFYAVASKSFPINDSQMLSVHAGAGTGRFQNRPFGGLEYAFDNGLAMLAEYDGWTSAFGLRYTGIQNLRLTAAVQGGRPTVQIGYSLNPFDWFRDDVDDHDLSPFARPVGKPSEEPPDKEIPSEEQAPPAQELPPARSVKRTSPASGDEVRVASVSPPFKESESGSELPARPAMSERKVSSVVPEPVVTPPPVRREAHTPAVASLPSYRSEPKASVAEVAPPSQPPVRARRYSSAAESSRPQTVKLRPDEDNPLPVVESL